jgi:hypothetical protein
MQTLRSALVPLLFVLLSAQSSAAAPRPHSVTLGPSRHVPYSPPEASTADKSEDATTLRVRPLFVDNIPREWTVGEIHDVTDRSFVIRRALRINDSLPDEQPRWTWQPGPWLLVDRITGHISALHLPDFDAQVSNVAWFRDYAAYCGISNTVVKGGIVAIVAQLGNRKPAAQKWLGPWPEIDPRTGASYPMCAKPTWQRTPMRATIQQIGGQPTTFNVVGTVSLIEENDNAPTDSAP